MVNPMVTSYAEVWIETDDVVITGIRVLVTSYAEVWIETKVNESGTPSDYSHLLRGGVD